MRLVTHRPKFSSRWSHYGEVTALTLNKLTRAQTAAMVSRLAGGKALPADLLDQILGKTDGVPLFVEELTRSILESGHLKEAGDRWEFAGAHNGFGGRAAWSRLAVMEARMTQANSSTWPSPRRSLLLS
jgi:predicted ATPase